MSRARDVGCPCGQPALHGTEVEYSRWLWGALEAETLRLQGSQAPVTALEETETLKVTKEVTLDTNKKMKYW